LRYNQGTFLGATNTELYYQSWHPASPPRAIVVGIHGHGDHSGGLRNIIQHLVPAGYAWYGFDLRGHGRSPGIRGHIQNWSDFQGDLQAFLRRVKQIEGEKPVFILGHSLGGLISIEYALRHPEGLSGIISTSPALGYSRLPPFKALLFRALSYLNPNYSLESLPDYAKLTRDKNIVEILAADPLRHEQMSLKLWREFLNARNWVREHAAELQVPILMLYGLDDTITPAPVNRQFMDTLILADKEHREYGQTLHRPFDDINRAEVLAHISAWLDRQNIAA
jgi:alpha-beta hydrolase superfamily lysophospholipase